MGAYLAGRDDGLDFVLSSPSVRTRETLEAVCVHLDQTPDVVFDDRIYNASVSQLMAAVRTAPDKYAHLLLVGHNPGVRQLALELAVAGDRHVMQHLEDGFPKGALAKFDLNADLWRETGEAKSVMTTFIRPKELRRV